MPSFPPKPSDTELTEAIKASDADAFKTLYHRYYKALYRLLWRRTRDDEVCKDIGQEVFIRVWTTRHKLDSNRSIKAYLYRIANNLAIDHQRKKSTQMAHLSASRLQEPLSFPEDDIGLREQILAAIDALPQPLQLVLTLNRFDGLKYGEIAEVLDISIKTVESRMSKALKILRNKLQPLLSAIVVLDFFS